MGTLKTQKHLEGLLADNSTKAISALDVRTIVTSNYQPQLIYAGFTTDNGSSENANVRVLYYNESFFSDVAITSGSDTACWKVINAGSGISDGTYTNQTLTPPNVYDGFGAGSLPWADYGGVAFGAVFNFTVSGGQISNVTVVSGGSGWIGKRAGADAAASQGMIGSFTGLPNATVNPTIEFIGPLTITSDSGDSIIMNMTVNNTLQGAQKNHVGMNTLAIISGASSSEATGAAFLPSQNTLRLQTDTYNTYFSLWRMPQFA